MLSSKEEIIALSVANERSVGVKNYLGALLMLASLALCACGGGAGSNPIPQATPTPTPTATPVTYTAKIVVRGGANTLQSDLRHTESVTLASSATPAPIMLGAPPFLSLPSGYSGGINGESVTVQAQVSPQPSSTPTATFSTTASGTQFAPLPSPLPDTQQLVDTTPNQSASSQTVTATIPSLNTQATRTLDIYPETFLFWSSSKPTPTGMSNGITLQSGKVVATNAGAGDVYLDGKGNLLISGGAIAISGDTLYCNLAASQWQNTFTSIPLNSIATQLTGSGTLTNQNTIFKANDGEIGKITFLSIMPGNGGGDQMLEIWVQVAGHSIDGF